MARSSSTGPTLESNPFVVTGFQKLVFSFILTSLHHLVDLLFRVVVAVKRFWRRLSRPANRQELEKDANFVSKNCLTFSKIPRHTALSFLEAEISLEDAAKLIVWCIAAGSQYISLYDLRNYFKRFDVLLLEALSDVMPSGMRTKYHLNWHNTVRSNGVSNGNGRNGDANGESFIKQIHIVLLSPEDGRPDIVRAARELITDPGVNISETLDEDAFGRALLNKRQLPDPELLIRFGPAHSNMGYPPWQLRLSEIHDIQTHCDTTVNEFMDVMSKYSKCEQRFGR